VNSSANTPLAGYRMAMGNYPSTAEGLQALIAAPAGKEGRWTGPYLTETKLPLDPWGNPYQYAFPGTHNKERPDIWSRGPDGQDGTADDIGNWDKTATKETK
jgi:general secretion pathway protein G